MGPPCSITSGVPLKVSEVPIGNEVFVRIGGKILSAELLRCLTACGVPLAPATDRTDVDMVDLRFACRIAVPERFDEPLMEKEERGIIVIRENVATDYDAADSFVAYPFRGRAFVHGHDAESESLPLGFRLPDHIIHKREIVLTLRRLEHVPRPSEICDRLGGVLFRGRKRFSPNPLQIGNPRIPFYPGL